MKKEQKQILVFLDIDLHEKLKLYSIAKGTSLSHVVRETLREKLDNVVIHPASIEIIEKT